MRPRVSIVVPVYHEGEGIIPCLDRIVESVSLPFEVLVVYDTPGDSTAPYAEKYAREDQRIRPTLNEFGPGPARALRFGIDHALAPVILVTMADGSDDVRQVDELTRLVERGAAIAAASRYAPGGQQVGGPLLKGFLSRSAGWLLFRLARVGTRDATNSFKAYSAAFVRSVGIHAEAGFEMGIELVAKARRLGLPVSEIPTTWLDRTTGTSNFKLVRWIPNYLRWFTFAFGPRLTPRELRRRMATR